MSNHIGHWQVGKEIFYHKPTALITAGKLKKSVSYHFYDQIYDNFDRSLLGKKTLDELYVERARQLREKYDYLILYYSGGSDSRNILQTFLKNNIKLDCVFVRSWEQASNSKIYPITHNTNSVNFMCEWDLTIKPDLEWLGKNHPEIKIETYDWTKDIFSVGIKDSLFEQQQHYIHLSSLFRIPTHSTMEKTMRERGRSVASIFGIDHPLVSCDHYGNVYFVFNDVSPTCFWASLENQEGQEYFYWTPDMPSIVFEQAYQIISFLNKYPQYINLFRESSTKLDLLSKKIQTASDYKSRILLRSIMNSQIFDQKNRLTKKIIYSSYDASIFQAEKPLRLEQGFIGNSKDFYLETHTELSKVKMQWLYHYQTWIKDIPRIFQDPPGFIKPITTKKFLVGKIPL